ncbi:MAG: hypothetical protein ABSA85_15070 [Terracidiphilus sp.]
MALPAAERIAGVPDSEWKTAVEWKEGATMILSERKPRLARVLGAVGAILGGIVACMVLQPLLSERARHYRFEQFANSDVVAQERSKILSEEKMGRLTPCDLDDSPDALPSDSVCFDSAVDGGGIRSIGWNQYYAVVSIETAEGQTLYSIPEPADWKFCVALLFPVAGFFILWGAVRAIGRMGTDPDENLF